MYYSKRYAKQRQIWGKSAVIQHIPTWLGNCVHIALKLACFVGALKLYDYHTVIVSLHCEEKFLFIVCSIKDFNYYKFNDFAMFHGSFL